MKLLNDTWTIAKKELMQHLKTKRLLVIGIIFAAVMMIISVYGGYLTGQDQSKPTYEQGAAQVLQLMLQFSAFFPPILAIALTYDAIVGERVNNSMYLLVSKPIRKETIYFGKVVGAWLAIAAVYTIVLSAGYALIVAMSGQMPSAGDVGNLYLVIGLILLGIAAWLSLVMLLSSAFKTTASALITAVLLWIFVLSIVSEAGLIYYAVTLPKADNYVNTGVSYTAWQNGTIVTLTEESLASYTENYSTTVTRLPMGIPTEPVPIPGGTQVFYYLGPGYYNWSAKSGANSGNASGNGTFYVLPGCSLQIDMGAHDKDNYVNDLSFAMTSAAGAPLPGGEYTLLRNGSAYLHENANYSFVTIKNLTAGFYNFSYSNNGTVLTSYQFYSYGDNAGGERLIRVLTGGNSDAPGYVKVMYAVNPDNCLGAYKYILDSKATGILTLNESVAALVVFTAVCGSLGLLLFRRRDLV